MINAISFAELIAALAEGEYTKTELREITGLHHATISKYLEQLRKRRVVRISEFKRDAGGRAFVALFTMNPEQMPDAKYPDRLPGSTRSRMYRARLKSKQLNQMMAGVLNEFCDRD